MKWRQHIGSLVALGLAVVVGGLAYRDRGSISDSERRDRERDVFPAYRRSEIDAIELAQGTNKIRIERRPDKGDAGDTYWQMTSPADERADPAAVDRFVGDLEFAGVIRKVDSSAGSDKALGFDAPRVRGTLSMKPLVYHFMLGGPAAAPEGAAYFRVDGEGTFVVSRDFVASLTNGPTMYRERAVVPYLSLDLAEMEITSAGGVVHVKRVDDIAFKLGQSGLRASRDEMDKLWGALAMARAEEFLTKDEGDKALGASPLRVTMTPKVSGRPKGEILLGGECTGHPDDIVLVRTAPTPLAACVPKGAKAGLSVSEATLVDTRLFVARQDEIEEITMETVPPHFAVELARKGKGWHERKPNDRELSGTEIDAMNDLVAKLARSDGVTVSPGSRQAMVSRAKIRVRRGGSGVEEVVELGGGTTEAKRVFDGASLDVPTGLGHRLVPSEIAFRARNVFGVALDTHDPRALRTNCDGVRQSLTHDAHDWKMQAPVGYGADSLATADLVGLVRNAQAEAWIADQDDGSFGFADSNCSVELETMTDAGKVVSGILFGKATEGGFYARATSESAVFLAPRALRDGMTVWLIDRGGFQADPRAIERVTLTRGKASVVLTPDPSRDGGGDKVARVVEALGVFRPEVVVHLGAPKADEGFGVPTLDVRVKLRGSREAPAREIHFVLGDTVLLNRERMVYTRVDGVDATYATAKERVGALIEGL